MSFSQKIYILEPSTFLQSELHMQAYEDFSNLHIIAINHENEILEKAQDAELIIINKLKISREIMSEMPSLKYIALTATGMDNVDAVAAKDLGIHVQNVKAYSTYSVAQHVMALILHLTNNVSLHNKITHDGSWSKHDYFSLWVQDIIELKEKCLGLVGYGEIAQRLAKIATAMGMQVLVYNRSKIEAEDNAIQQIDSLDEFLPKLDFLSLHIPLFADTANIIDQNYLSKLNKRCVLINSSRGGLIDEDALCEALRQKDIKAACLDVLKDEPPPIDHPLLALENCIITPHIAWASIAARQRLIDKTAAQIKEYYSV